MNSIVIIGGGHAAAQLCAGLAEAGQAQRVHLVCEEACEPYHRPPLSKAFLKSADQATQAHRPQLRIGRLEVHQVIEALDQRVDRGFAADPFERGVERRFVLDLHGRHSVSYTHLTLPTKA